MLNPKSGTIFLMLFLMKITSSTSENVSTESTAETLINNVTSTQRAILFHISSKFLGWEIEVVGESADYCRLMLNDMDLLTNEQPKVLEFKQNLTKFLEGYEKSLGVLNIIDIFINITDKYLDFSQTEETPAFSFIKNLLHKFHVEDIVRKFKKDFLKIEDDLRFLFLLEKEKLDKPLLDWFEKLESTNSLGEKIIGIKEFKTVAQLKKFL